MDNNTIVSETIERLRPLIKSGFTTFRVAPVLQHRELIKIEYDDRGHRKVLIKDLMEWKEHKYIDHELESTLSSSGYGIIQPATSPQLSSVSLDCQVIRFSSNNSIVLSVSCEFAKYKSMDGPSYDPDLLMLLPDHCLSMYPFFVRINLDKCKPNDARIILDGALDKIGNILEHRKPSEMLRGNKDSVIAKISKNYPTIDRRLIKGLTFVLAN